MNNVVLGRALGEARAASLLAAVALVALRLLRLVSAGVAAHKAHSENGHHGQLVWLRLGLGAGDSGGAGQDGDGGGSSEEHVCGLMRIREGKKGVQVARKSSRSC